MDGAVRAAAICSNECVCLFSFIFYKVVRYNEMRSAWVVII